MHDVVSHWHPCSMADASLENTNRKANVVKHHHKRTDSLKMIR